MRDVIDGIEGCRVILSHDRPGVVTLFIDGVAWGGPTPCLVLDLNFGFFYKGLEILPTELLLASRRPAPSKPGPLLILGPIEETCGTALFRLIAYGGIGDREWQETAAAIAAAPDEARRLLEIALPASLARELSAAEGPDQAALLVPRLRRAVAARALARAPLCVLGRVARHYRQELAVRFTPRNKVPVCFLGPDGVGKSTLMDAVSADLRPLFPGLRLYHLKHVLFMRRRQEDRGTVTDPHGKPPRGFLSSALKLALWV
ncbi:MAG TPA: hypothetical protein VD970_07045, partial [Acetobacteraceae bacterium]|nr:hypothetical protein [Acetobacteraceae bacterium]